MASVVQQQVDCETAEEFLSAISPIGPYFGDLPEDQVWLFRGQGLDYPLVPSAFRVDRDTGIKDPKLSRLAGREINSYGDQRLAERDVLARFFDIADKRGDVLPDDSQQLRSTIETLRSSDGDLFTSTGRWDWNAAETILSITALAQHYQVPTRLLDWTRNGYMAAYFAGEGAFRELRKNPEKRERMVVWAFYFPLLGKHRVIEPDQLIRVVTAPTASNPNLKAQQGVFTVLHPLYTLEGEDFPNYRPMDETLEWYAAQYLSEEPNPRDVMVGCKMRKFTAPISESPNFLRLLGRLDITPSAVFPGLHSVVEDMELQAQLRAYVV